MAEDVQAARAVPLTWLEALDRLAAAGGQLRLHQLADALGRHKSSTSRLVDRLAALGHVRRDGVTDDGRGSMIVLTRDGRAFWRSAQPSLARSVHEHFGRHLADDEVATLIAVLAKLPGIAPDDDEP